MSQVTKRIVFAGRVQGVGFRFTAHRIALRHDLTGWVRNLPDGAVEMVAQGRDKEIAECIRDIKDGFEGYIRETTIEDAPADPQYRDFKITF